MSHHRYAAPLRIPLRPSRRLATLLALVIAGAAAWPFVVPMHWGIRLFSLWLTIAVGYRTYVDHFGARRITEAVWDGEGRWTLSCADGNVLEGSLRGDSVTASWLLLLNVDVGSRSVSVIIPDDACDLVTLRRLRVRLRLEGMGKAGEGKGRAPV